MPDSVERARAVMNGMVRVTGECVRGAHDAQMVIVDGFSYVVYEANDVRPGEGAWPFIYSAMSVVDAAAGRVTAIHRIAGPGQRFANAQLKPGRCFVPRVLVKDERTLRCFFWSIDEGHRETESWYRDYDPVSGVFSSCVFPLFMETETGRVPLTPSAFYKGAREKGFRKPLRQDGPYLFDADKVIDGRRYAMLNIFTGQLNALAAFNDDLDAVRVLSYIFDPQDEALSEAAVEKTPDGRWTAILRNDGGDRNYRFAVSPDGVHWTAAEERPFVMNGSNSKPFLYRFGNVYCLGWQEKPDRSRFNIDVSADFVNWTRMFSFDDEDFSLQYPSLAVWNGTVYLCATHCHPGTEGDRREAIWFGRLCALSDMEKTAGG